MIAFDRQEALRYLGYRNTEPDTAVADSLARCAAELQAAVQPKSVFAAFPLSHPAENTLEIAGVTIHSKNLSRNLKGCEQVYLMAATLGVTADRLTPDERIQIIASLETGGIFLLKGAVKDVADALHCSQASVYRYLSQIKKDGT